MAEQSHAASVSVEEQLLTVMSALDRTDLVRVQWLLHYQLGEITTEDVRAANVRNSRLLRLPRELLDRIISFVVPSSLDHGDYYRCITRRVPSNVRACLQVCHSLRVSTGDIYYSCNNFTSTGYYWEVAEWVGSVGEFYDKVTFLAVDTSGFHPGSPAERAAALDARFGMVNGTVWVRAWEVAPRLTEGEVTYRNAEGEIIWYDGW